MTKPAEKPAVSDPVKPVVSGELIKAEYDGYRGYHTYTKIEDCPYTGELQEAWLSGQAKAEKEDN